MLNCRACLWRCLQALDATQPSLRSLRRHVSPSLLPGRQQRSLRTSTNVVRKAPTKPSSLTEVEKLHRSKREPYQTSGRAASLHKQAVRGLGQPVSKARASTDIETRSPRKYGRRDPTMSPGQWNNRRKELAYLADPLELANFVKQELGKGHVTEMLQLVRMASHSMQCIVSWNHIIDDLLAKGRVAPALKVYNDMKKRAQFPDSYTYTIILRGLSINAHQSGALANALSVYHSMSAPNSRVQPSIIHTNAVLKVCARVPDMDAMWGVIAKLPQSGPASANGRTYVTILNAIRQSLLINAPLGETAESAATRRERGIMEGRRIWEEVVHKWKSADLVIEEELVCAMGRLLLVGVRPRDWDDVLSLVEQTMDVPRLVPRLGSIARREAGFPSLRAPDVPEQFRHEDAHLTPEKGYSNRGDEFLPVATQGVGGAVSDNLAYATPSNNTLSLVLEASQKVVAAKAAEEYWNMLTDPTTYNIVPDINNLHQRLRILRQNRSSAKAVELLKEDLISQGLGPKPGTFRIAMSTCVRDKNNHNSLRHAGQILELMGNTLEDVDPKAVTMYAELAIEHPLAKGDELLDALNRLQPVTNNIRLQLGVGAASKSAGGVGASYLTGAERNDAIAALRKIFGLHDRLVNSDLINEDEKKPVKKSRARMSAYLHRLAFKDGEHKKARLERAALGQDDGNDGETPIEGDGESEASVEEVMNPPTSERAGEHSRTPAFSKGRLHDRRQRIEQHGQYRRSRFVRDGDE